MQHDIDPISQAVKAILDEAHRWEALAAHGIASGLLLAVDILQDLPPQLP